MSRRVGFRSQKQIRTFHLNHLDVFHNATHSLIVLVMDLHQNQTWHHPCKHSWPRLCCSACEVAHIRTKCAAHCVCCVLMSGGDRTRSVCVCAHVSFACVVYCMYIGVSVDMLTLVCMRDCACIHVCLYACILIWVRLLACKVLFWSKLAFDQQSVFKGKAYREHG